MPTAPSRATALLLNVAHALDHMFLLIFATAVGTIAVEFGFADWESLMPYGVGAFMLFGFGSLPAGRLGDLWGRRRMMLLFFVGMGASSLLVAVTRNAWQLAGALTLLGAFSSIYHPVGIPMLVRGAKRPGLTIGINGLSGNLGVALAAVTTGLLVKYVGWRAAFVVPAVVAFACGIAFARVAPKEIAPPAHAPRAPAAHDAATLARVFAVMTVAAISSNLLFNFTTNGNGQLLRERFVGIVEDPALLGVLLACDERTIRRDIQALRAQGIHVPTRGYVQDIGPTLSHKGLAVRHWLQGKEPVAVARAINHSLAAVERYLEDFKRVSLLVIKGLDETAIARAANMSPALVKSYQAMYQEAKTTPAYAYRFTELMQFLTDEKPADTTSCGKKGAL